MEKGEGSWVMDTEGKWHVDLGAGIAVSALGHANPDLVQALKEQAERIWHTSNLYEIPRQAELAKALAENTFADLVFFTNSGAEAMECAIKMARKHWFEAGSPERCEILTLEGAFHGRTMATISAAGQEKLTKGFGPLLPGFKSVPFLDIQALEAEMGGQTAAVIVEPVQGEGGIRPVPDKDLKRISELCRENGALLILDEIQCGMGRTGRLFAHEWAGIAPDIMAIAKGIGGGFPLGACLATEKAASGMTAGTHGSTYGGNPLACAVGMAVLKAVTAEGFLEEVSRKAGLLRQRLEGLAASNPEVFGEVRGQGMMMGIVCKKPNVDIVQAAVEEGVLTVPGGDNTIRVLPPLNISDDDMGEGISRLEKAARGMS